MSEKLDALANAAWLLRATAKWYIHDHAYDAATQCNTAAAALEALSSSSGSAAPVAEALSKRCYTMSEPHLSGYRLVIGFTTLSDVQDAHQAVAASPLPEERASSIPVQGD